MAPLPAPGSLQPQLPATKLTLTGEAASNIEPVPIPSRMGSGLSHSGAAVPEGSGQPNLPQKQEAKHAVAYSISTPLVRPADNGLPSSSPVTAPGPRLVGLRPVGPTGVPETQSSASNPPLQLPPSFSRESIAAPTATKPRFKNTLTVRPTQSPNEPIQKGNQLQKPPHSSAPKPPPVEDDGEFFWQAQQEELRQLGPPSTAVPTTGSSGLRPWSGFGTGSSKGPDPLSWRPPKPRAVPQVSSTPDSPPPDSGETSADAMAVDSDEDDEGSGGMSSEEGGNTGISPGPVPESVEVFCGNISGTLMVHSMRIRCRCPRCLNEVRHPKITTSILNPLVRTHM